MLKSNSKFIFVVFLIPLWQFSFGQDKVNFSQNPIDTNISRLNYQNNYFSILKDFEFQAGDGRYLGRQYLLYQPSDNLLNSGIRNNISTCNVFESKFSRKLDSIRTNLRYYRATKKENFLFVDHYQKISRSVDVRINWASIISPGFFRNQRIDRRKLGIKCNFISQNNRLKLVSFYTTDRYQTGENGGVNDSIELKGLVVRDFRTVKVSIDDGNSLTKSKNMGLRLGYNYLRHERFAAILNYQALYQLDKFEFSATDLHSFKNVYFDSLKTSDSTFFGSFENRLSSTLTFLQRKNLIEFEIGTYTTRVNYFQRNINLNKNLFSGFMNVCFTIDSLINLYSNYELSFLKNKSFTNLSFGIKGRSKYKLLDEFNFLIESKEQLTPFNYAYQQSNHFYWINSQMMYKQQSLQLSLKNALFRINSRLDFWDNYFFIDSRLKPALTKDVMAFSAVLEKELSYRSFQFSPFIKGSASNKQKIWLVPKFVPGIALGFEHNLKKQNLTLSYNISYMYIPSHFAFGFQPGLNMFYTKSNSKLAEMHYLDFTFSGKIKSFLFFVEVDNILNGLTGQYFALSDIPMQRRTIRMGVNWGFKN